MMNVNRMWRLRGVADTGWQESAESICDPTPWAIVAALLGDLLWLAASYWIE